MLGRTEVRTNGKPGVAELHWGTREILSALAALVTILMAISGSCVGITSKITAVEVKVDNLDKRLTGHELSQRSIEEHVIRNTEWIDRERSLHTLDSKNEPR